MKFIMRPCIVNIALVPIIALLLLQVSVNAENSDSTYAENSDSKAENSDSKAENSETMSCQGKLASYEDVKALKDDKNVLLIDVREPNELTETGVIPGSINIPLATVEDVLKDMPEDEFQAKFGRPKPAKDFPLVFSCRSGRRSDIAMQTAIKLGYCNVRNYGGGWLDWEKHL